MTPNSSSSVAPSTRPLVLVLPFVAPIGDDGSYLAEGVSDELVLALTQLSALDIIARGTAATFRDSSLSPAERAASIEATVVVTGTVVRIDGKLRVEATIASVTEPSREHHASEWLQPASFTTGVARLAESIARFCGVSVDADWREQVSRPMTEDPEVFDLLLRGRYHLEQRPIGVKLAMQCFDRAIRLDGTVAGANGALGILWANFGIFLALPPAQARERAREQAMRALAIDPREPNALAALLTIAALYDWDFPRAEALWAQLQSWYPSWVNPRQVMLYVHAARRDSAAVRALGAEVRRLDPRSVDPVSDVGLTLLLTGNAGEAAELLAAHARLHPEASEVHRRLGLAWLEAGNATLAVTHLERSVALSRRHAWGVANLACARARAGNVPGARALLAELLDRADGELVPGTVLAEVHASLGDLDLAFAALERGITARDYWLLAIDVDPLLAPLRADPRFAALRARCTPVRTTEA